jgi:pyruvate,orthophosphate dikinase
MTEPPARAPVAARGQGRQPRRDDVGPRSSGAARIHDLDRRVPRVHAKRLAGRAHRGDERPPRPPRGAMGRRLGDPADPLLVSVRSGAEISMPGMMDTVLNLGLNDASVEGLAARPTTSASPSTPIVASSRCTARIVLDLPGEGFDERSRLPASARAGHRRRDPARGARELIEPTRRSSRRQAGNRSRAIRSTSCAARSKRCSPRGTARGRTPTASRADLPRPRHRGQRPGDGLRQPRRQLRNRGRLHPRPVDRRERPLRRLPRERPGRGRRRRHPSDRAARARSASRCPRSTRSCSRSSPASKSTFATCATPSSPSSRASSGCCRPGPASAPARRAPHGGRDDRRSGDRTQSRTSGESESPKSTSTASCTRSSPAMPSSVLTQGLGASPGAAVGGVCFSAARAVELAHEGPKVILVRNETSPDDVDGMLAAKGSSRREAGSSATPRSSHGMGQARRRRSRGARRQCHVVPRRRRRARRGRRDLDRRQRRHGRARGGALTRPIHRKELATLLGWADEIRAGRLAVRANADNGPTPQRPPTRCRGHRTLSHRAHVPRRRSPADHATDDPRRGRRPRMPRSRSSGSPSGTTSSRSSGDGRPPGHRPPARPAAS